MKRFLVLTAALAMFFANSAMAESTSAGHAASGHKLLVTDVPNPGQVEARVDYTYSYAEGKNDLDEKVKDEISAASISLAAGVTKGLKLSASLPYTFVQHAENEFIQGFGDLTLGARYSFSKGGMIKLPVDLALGLDWQLNSASTRPGKPGSGVNTYSPYIAASKSINMFIPYVKYQPDFVAKAGQDHTNHNFTVGSEIEFSHHYSLDIAVKTVVNGPRRELKSSTDVEVEVAPYINLAKNIYLLPKVAYKFIGDIKDDTGVKVLRNADEIKTGLGVYFLF